MTTVFRKARVQRTQTNYRTGGGEVFTSNYYGSSPPFVPARVRYDATPAAVAVDNSNGNLWLRYAEAWHQFVGGGGGGASQVVAYTTTDPNTDGVLPPDQTKPAIAVKPGDAIFVWNISGHTWA